MTRTNLGSGVIWEDIVGYSRAVKVGNVIEVAGTTAMNGDELVGKGDAYLQTKYILEKIALVLEQLGSKMEDVVRTRIYVTNIEEWEAVGKAHGEFFKHINPAATMVEVSRLIHPDLKVEIEVSAIMTNL